MTTGEDHRAGSTCANCGAALTGPWCAQCGQRHVDEGERKFGHLLRDAFSAMTSLDSRFWRSFFALMVKPGRLSRDYIDGKRARWLAPLTIFVLVNLLYFLSPAMTDFNLPFGNQVPGRLAIASLDNPEALSPAQRAWYEEWGGQAHSPFTAPLVERRVEHRHQQRMEQSGGERGYTMADYRRAYEAINTEASKLLIGIHIPFVALALTGLFWRSRLYFAEHFIAALHFMSFALLLQQIMIGPISLIGRYWGGPWFITVFQILSPLSLVLIVIYLVTALRVIYAARWWHAALATPLIMLSVMVGHYWIYRPVQFMTIFAFT